ncbi:SpaA isopeptide-forming pilin-related protein [Companilactobacillus huachuanensis]|uniref:SpaA isopeptide-forming pilin-related protein n=1 Tax=Companilactobacillus huachuanensis TaxID=2559914 RepID=A0ABW1RLV9_9LACO|nr:SpaA isopeptide-forming pilin-related protein [Companilactobacillus huachuanensis]
MKSIKREFFAATLIAIAILGLFTAFLLLLSPGLQTAKAATTSPPTTATTISSPKAISQATTGTPKKELNVAGLTGNDATITDMNGNPVKPSDNLYAWINFNISYDWSIPDGVPIDSGDTVSFELPSGITTPGDMSFPIYDSNNVEIGVATLKAGAKTGTITFNDALESTTANRHGTISLVAKGTNTGDGNEGNNWMFNKNGWIAGFTPKLAPSELAWNLAFNPNEQTLHNVVLTDTLGPNQEYIPGSLTAMTGYFGTSGFVSSGEPLYPVVTTEGNKVIITFPEDVTTAVDIYYRTKVTGTNPNGTTTWTNSATMGSSEGNYSVDSSTSWGGSGTGGGELKVGSITITKTDATTNQALSGAEYELKDARGKVIISNAVTDADGKVTINDLPYGTYTLLEVRAPDGYLLNTNTHVFTIPDNGSVNLMANEKDDAPTGSVVLKKLDPNSNATIAGATFELQDKNGNVIKQGIVTDGNGELAVEDLPAGEYQFVETSPAAGYLLNKTPIEFTIVANQTTPVTLEKFDDPTTGVSDTGNVVLTKVDATLNKLLPGAVFDLLDSNGKVIQSNLTTNEKGQIVVSNLEAGDYSFVETIAPEGYELDKTPIKFTVTKDMTNNLEAKDKKEPSKPGVVVPPTEPGKPKPPVVNPGPGKPKPPVVNPGPGKPKPPVVNPGPGKPKPPVVNPGPGKPKPPVVNPGPGKPKPPVVNPVEPGKPGVTTPPVVNPVEPGKPGVTTPPVVNPVEPGIPSVTIPGGSTSTTNPNPSTELPSTGNSSGSGYGVGKFPQTGNENGLLMMLGGFFIALFVLLRHLIKKLA